MNRYMRKSEQNQNDYITTLKRQVQEKDTMINELKELVMLSYVEGGMDMRARKESSWRDSASKTKLRMLLENPGRSKNFR